MEDPINFKLRWPNSEIVQLRLPKDEKVQYLFDFIESYEEQEMGFEN